MKKQNKEEDLGSKTNQEEKGKEEEEEDKKDDNVWRWKKKRVKREKIKKEKKNKEKNIKQKCWASWLNYGMANNQKNSILIGPVFAKKKILV